jgi:flagellar protein FlgJ
MALKRAGAQQQTVNLPAAEKAFETKAGSLMAESYGEVAKQGVASSRALGTLTRLESLLDKTGGGLVPALQSFAGQFGIKSKGSSDIEAAQAVINRLVPEQRAPGSGTMSDRDIELFKASLPRLINTPEGNRQILEAMRGIVEYDIKASQIARDALNGRIKQDEAEKRLNDLRNPLEQFRSQARLKFNPQTGRLE